MTEPTRGRVGAWMAGWQFPVFALALLSAFCLLSVVVLLFPVGHSGFSEFAESFRMWCFGYDPATGKMEIAYVAMMFANPLLLAALLIGVWGPQIRGGFVHEKRSLLGVAGAAALTVSIICVGFFFVDTTGYDGPLPFPAEEIRTAYEPPQFSLTDHNGETVSLSDFAGDVVVITSIYSCCPDACPLILQQAQRVIGSLTDAEREDVHVLAISMDPARDTPESLGGMARAHGVDPDVFHLLVGGEEETFSALDRLGVERRTDPETGLIDHTSMFITIDRQGRIAYRFAMGELQEAWLTTALRLLVAEGAPRS